MWRMIFSALSFVSIDLARVSVTRSSPSLPRAVIFGARVRDPMPCRTSDENDDDDGGRSGQSEAMTTLEDCGALLS